MKKQRTRNLVLIGALVLLLLMLTAGMVLAAGVVLVRQIATPEAQPAPSVQLEQEEIIVEGGVRGFLGRGLLGGRFGHHGGREGGDENLADALGITVEELAAARERAFAQSLADAVAEGLITQEQADAKLAMRALRNYLDREALLAEALGMSVEELEAALAAGTLTDLMTERGIDAATLRANVQTAHEAAVARAVADGVITQAQADAILSQNMGFGMGLGPHGFEGRGGGHGRGGRHHGGRGGEWDWDALPEATPDADTTDTSSDA